MLKDAFLLQNVISVVKLEASLPDTVKPIMPTLGVAHKYFPRNFLRKRRVKNKVKPESQASDLELQGFA